MLDTGMNRIMKTRYLGDSCWSILTGLKLEMRVCILELRKRWEGVASLIKKAKEAKNGDAN